MEALYLRSQGLSHQQIQQCRVRSRTTLANYLRQYKAGGIEALKQLHYKGQASQLNAHIPSLKAHFEAQAPRTSAEAGSEIERITGIKRSPTQIKAFFKRIGMAHRKTGYLPGKAASPEKIEEQKQFRVNELEPRLEAARAGERNVLGAVDAVSKTVVTVANNSYINAKSVCELLLKLAALNQGMPITLVLDNARYQKCQIVFDLAKGLDIELLYLPAYSPQLNLIERLWKSVRNDCLYSKDYDEFDDFKHAMESCLEKANTTHKQALES